MNLPKITVVVPSYNQAEFLGEALASVVGQRYSPLELFVVDGGSTDGSKGVIAQYADHINWWVSERDKGQSDAIRKGFARASGDLIGWLNSDDAYFPEALHRVAETYQRDPTGSLYTGGVAIGGHHNAGIVRCAYPAHPMSWFKRSGVFYLGQMATFFSRASYEATTGVDISLTQIMDRDILYKLVQANPHVRRVPGMVGFIRFHDNAKSAARFASHYEDRANEIAAFLSRNSIDPKRFARLTKLHKLLRFVTLNYAVSYVLTRRYKGMPMRSVWMQARVETAQALGGHHARP